MSEYTYVTLRAELSANNETEVALIAQLATGLELSLPAALANIEIDEMVVEEYYNAFDNIGFSTYMNSEACYGPNDLPIENTQSYLIQDGNSFLLQLAFASSHALTITKELAEEIASFAGTTLANDITAIACSEYESYESDAREITYDTFDKNDEKYAVSDRLVKNAISSDFASDLEENVKFLQFAFSPA